MYIHWLYFTGTPCKQKLTYFDESLLSVLHHAPPLLHRQRQHSERKLRAVCQRRGRCAAAQHGQPPPALGVVVLEDAGDPQLALLLGLTGGDGGGWGEKRRRRKDINTGCLKKKWQGQTRLIQVFSQQIIK